MRAAGKLNRLFGHQGWCMRLAAASHGVWACRPGRCRLKRRPGSAASPASRSESPWASLFALLVRFVVLRWCGCHLAMGAEAGNALPSRSPGRHLITGLGLGFLLRLLFPPFLTLLRFRTHLDDKQSLSNPGRSPTPGQGSSFPGDPDLRVPHREAGPHYLPNGRLTVGPPKPDISTCPAFSPRTTVRFLRGPSPGFRCVKACRR